MSQADLERLVNGLKSRNVKVRAEAARDFGVLCDPKALPYLASALKDRSESVRELSAWSIVEISRTNFGNGVLNESVPNLIESLNDSSWCVRSRLAEALGVIKDKRALIPLLKLAGDKDSCVRDSVASALALIGLDSASIDFLILSLENTTSPLLRHGAARTLRLGRVTKAKDALLKILETDNSSAWSEALEAMHEWNVKDSVPVTSLERSDQKAFPVKQFLS